MAAAAIQEAVRADGVDALVPEEAKQERAEDTADEVDGDDVERVVEAEEHLQAKREIADQPGQRADDDSGVRVDESGARRDRRQPRHRSGNGAQHGGVPVGEAFPQQPDEHCRGCGDLGVDHSLRRDIIRPQAVGPVEAEPAEPQQAGA